jgi:hypothetical protein
MDALLPFVDMLESMEDIGKAAKVAEERAMNTKDLKARLGWAVSVGEDSCEGLPNPAAYGLIKAPFGVSTSINPFRFRKQNSFSPEYYFYHQKPSLYRYLILF